MTRLILTVAEARTIQQSPTLPAHYAELEALSYPETPDTLTDPARMAAGLKMVERGCTDEQIALQMNWKPASSPLRQLRRIFKQSQKNR